LFLSCSEIKQVGFLYLLSEGFKKTKRKMFVYAMELDVRGRQKADEVAGRVQFGSQMNVLM